MIHADRFSFQATEETSVASATQAEVPASGEVEECLVAFVCSETADSAGPDDVVAQGADQIRSTAKQVAASRVVVYPYAHLSNDLAKPQLAAKVVAGVARELREASGLEVYEAPFGHYKAFEIACKGHPMSELAVTLVPRSAEASVAAVPDAHESKAIGLERSLRSEWRIYHPDGSWTPADAFDFSADHGLRDLYAYEREGNRTAEDAPPHIRLMREQELVDYERASDAGNFRWYPKGLLLKRLLEQHVTNLYLDAGAMEVETPIMYDYGHPALAKYLDRFPARQYVVRSDDKEYFLRFAACFGQYMIAHDMSASYRDLPVRLYELTHYSFRREQGGEVAGLRRLRSFTMPDMHTVVRDFSMAKEHFAIQVELCLRWLQDIELTCVPAIRFVRSFLDEHPDLVADVMKKLGRPALVEVWDERFFYFVAKFEMNFVDTAKKAACLSTVQLDVENTERFDIEYVTEAGVKERPLLLHTSLSGSIDRNVYAMLENQAMRVARNEKAHWPTWLAPIQVRLLPVSDSQIEGAKELARRIPFRVDIDDRDAKLGKKVRDAEREWVPYTIVVGQRELEGGPLTVRRRSGEQEQMSLEQLVVRLDSESADKPRRAANTPRTLSSRPIFVG